MNTAVRERTQAPANRGVRDLPSDTEPFMTREARAERAAWRLAHPKAWRAELAELGHFDSEFIYEVAHEYDHDWTTDPDYGAECVDLCEYDEDGVLSPPEKRAPKIQERMSNSVADALTATDREVDLEADYEVEVRFHTDTIEFANRVADEHRPVLKGVRPDLMVQVVMSAQEREHFMPKGVLRLDLGAQVPQLVLEILFKGSAGRDLDYKRHLYAAAGVFEYLVYDLGGKRRANSPRELLLYRLQPDGTYHRIRSDSDVSATAPAEFWSEVFDTYIRFLPDAREEDAEFRGRSEENRPPPRFQWWDAEQGRWRDRESDAVYEQERKLARVAQENRQEGLTEGMAIGREEERADHALATLRGFLRDVLAPTDLDRIVAVWHRDGPPENYLQCIKATLQTPSAWQSLLLSVAPDDDHDNGGGPDRTLPPREPGPPKDRR